MSSRLPVLLAAAGARWETTALRILEDAGPRVVLHKRCLDLPDLLATAATGQTRVAVVAAELPGLDNDSVAHLRRCGTEVVLVATDPVSEERYAGGAGVGGAVPHGVAQVLPAGALEGLVDAVAAAGAGPRPEGAEQPGPEVGAGAREGHAAPPAEAGVGGGDAPPAGRVLVVWGPGGAPGRTTVSVGVAAELAHRGHSTFLLDADCYGGAVAQHLGVLDEASGVLGAARMANGGALDAERLTGLAREVAPGLRVLTGLPRADRWSEVRTAAFAQVLEHAAELDRYLVVDTGFSLETEPVDLLGGAAPQRNDMTLTALERADEVVVVGGADPVGLARLARGLVELRDVAPDQPVRVVVNRNRSSLGWAETEVARMIEGFVRPTGLHFLPDDREAADAALMAGRSLVEVGDSPLRRAFAGMVDAALGDAPATRRRRGVLRRAARRR